MIKTTRYILTLSLLLSSFNLVATANDDDELYYAAEKAFSADASFELRLGAGFDVSNPFLNVFSGHASGYYLHSDTLAFGIESHIYTSSRRGSLDTLESALGSVGAIVETNAPQYKLALAARVTPVSGLVNLFSSKIVRANINFIGRAGTVKYENLGTGPMVGCGLETHLEWDPQFGLFTAISWDFEKPASSPWQVRSGFLVGPTLRF